MLATPYPDEVLELIAERFRVLAEPARLRLLHTLMMGERTVTQLVEETGLGQANVSKHLQLLRTGGFVQRRKEGLFAIYSIQDPTVEDLCRIMCDRLEADVTGRTELLATGGA